MTNEPMREAHSAEKDALGSECPNCFGVGSHHPTCSRLTTERDAPVCECYWTDPSTWLSAASCGHGGGYEPGSQMEWNPDCPMHPRATSPAEGRA